MCSTFWWLISHFFLITKVVNRQSIVYSFIQYALVHVEYVLTIRPRIIQFLIIFRLTWSKRRPHLYNQTFNHYNKHVQYADKNSIYISNVISCNLPYMNMKLFYSTLAHVFSFFAHPKMIITALAHFTLDHPIYFVEIYLSPNLSISLSGFQRGCLEKDF